ncbi:MAG: superoxide dismutase [Minisyncoccia bacterium]
MNYEEQKFSLPEMEGLSKNSIDQHLSLYAGYVKNFNAMTALAGDLIKADAEKNAPAVAELMRRRSFEFDGMRLHEYYFSQWEKGASELGASSALGKAIEKQYGKGDYCTQEVRGVGMMRGPGWSILYFDPKGGQFLVGFTEQQHQGHFATLPIILALDVWEHAYTIDYGVGGKAKYIDAFFNNLNWQVMEERFEKITS